ncbi:MAG: amidohydrolase [Deltaproteobacteria bacterium]|nr:amidohydrolase [Deltaproteobacteria bacterium]
MRSGFWIAISLLLAAIVSCGPGEEVEQPRSLHDQEGADWVLTGGRIYTVADERPWAEAVAIKDGRFVYVGDDAGVEPFLSDRTRSSDLAGRLVIPGMIDSHTHPGYIDLERYGATLPETNHEEILRAVADHASSHPDDDWIRLCCWPNGLYVRGREGPHKRELDAIVPDRPVWIASVAWHSYWLNSKALEVLGVDDSTADPRPGIATYARDENGELTGWVKEGAGWQHLAGQFSPDTKLHQQGMTAFLQKLSEHGVTTVYDGGNFGYEKEVYGFLAGLERSGKLPLRYEGTYQVFTPERRKHAVAEMKRLRRTYGGDRLQFNTVKLFMDGVNENRSGAMLDPYGDDPDYVGQTMLTADELKDFILELHREKFDLHVHTIGDLAVRTVLDALERAQAEVGGDLYPRLTIAHLEVINAADLARIKELGVAANFTPWWHGVNEGDSVAHALGEDRFSNTYTARPLFDLGARVTFSSDDWRLPVLSPFLGMQVGHTRQYPKEWLEGEAFSSSASRPPESEQLDLELMVRGYTINGAYPFRMEDQIGSIETGKLADLVVLDEDLFEMDPSDIHEIKPSAVVMEGELIHGDIP